MSDINASLPVTRIRKRSVQLQSEHAAPPPAQARRPFGTYVDPKSLIISRTRLRKPKRAQQENLQRNMRRFGCVLPVLVDANGRIISGHSLVEAALAIGLQEISIVLIEGLEEAEIAALRVSLHKIEERSEWDEGALRDAFTAIADFDVDLLTFTAFSTQEIDVILEPEAKPADKPNPDDALPPPLPKTVSRPGDIWCFDKGHRLACGDAGDASVYDRLMGGVRARLVLADAPFNVPVVGHVSGRPGAREFAEASGEMSPEQFTTFLLDAFRLVAVHALDGSLHLFFMDWRHIDEMMTAGRQVYSELKNLIVWTKTNAGMGSLWRSQHELVFAWKLGTASHVNNVELDRHGRWRSNVWSYPGANSFGRTRDKQLADHVTPKNVAMIKDAILDVTTRGDVVLDCFCGAGTTLVAAHRARRIGMGIEIDPVYVDASVLRMEAVTGQPARHTETGLTFAEMMAARNDAQPGADA